MYVHKNCMLFSKTIQFKNKGREARKDNSKEGPDIRTLLIWDLTSDYLPRIRFRGNLHLTFIRWSRAATSASGFLSELCNAAHTTPQDCWEGERMQDACAWYTEIITGVTFPMPLDHSLPGSSLKGSSAALSVGTSKVKCIDLSEEGPSCGSAA